MKDGSTVDVVVTRDARWAVWWRRMGVANLLGVYEGGGGRAGRRAIEALVTKIFALKKYFLVLSPREDGVIAPSYILHPETR